MLIKKCGILILIRQRTDLFLEAVRVPNDEVESVYVDVVFDAQNGQPTTTQRILKGSTVTQPSDPIQDHFVFSRWSPRRVVHFGNFKHQFKNL
ncbi:hypothetical protein MGH68_14695 [Erysipelothrix sp. D19-032]